MDPPISIKDINKSNIKDINKSMVHMSRDRRLTGNKQEIRQTSSAKQGKREFTKVTARQKY